MYDFVVVAKCIECEILRAKVELIEAREVEGNGITAVEICIRLCGFKISVVNFDVIVKVQVRWNGLTRAGLASLS